MATTVSYAASLCTRRYTSSSNAKSSAACQEFYDSSYNYVGIISFSGMNLANKVITGIWLDIDAAKAGYGAGSTKTVFLRKANYQNGIASGVAGWEYTGDELGTFDGSFYGNYTSYYITGSLFNAMAAYIAAGNNSFTIYNPYASASSHGYSFNYLQWESVVIENPIYIGVYHIIISMRNGNWPEVELPYMIMRPIVVIGKSHQEPPAMDRAAIKPKL